MEKLDELLESYEQVIVYANQQPSLNSV